MTTEHIYATSGNLSLIPGEKNEDGTLALRPMIEVILLMADRIYICHASEPPGQFQAVQRRFLASPDQCRDVAGNLIQLADAADELAKAVAEEARAEKSTDRP